MSPCHGGGHHLNSWYPLQFGNMMGNDRDMRWGWCQAGISKTGLLVEAARGWPLDISETQGAVKGWKVMSENCYFRAGGKRLITTWHQSLKADKMLQQWSRRHLPDILFVLFFLVHFGSKLGERGEKRGKEKWLTCQFCVNYYSFCRKAALLWREVGLSVTRILLISLWHLELFMAKRNHPVYSTVFYLSAALWIPKQTSSAEVRLPPVSPWRGLTGCCAL